jgi:hypothetical protein
VEPCLRAVKHVGRLRGGCQSHLLRCTDKKYYAVKFKNNPQGKMVLANDYLATRLAALLSVPVAPCKVIDVDSEIIVRSYGLIIEHHASPASPVPCEPGRSFGSLFVGQRDGCHDDLPNNLLRHCLKNPEAFLASLVFDIWTANTDSRQVVFVRDRAGSPYRATMIDQGLAFGGDWKFNILRKTYSGCIYRPTVVYEKVAGIETFEPWLEILENRIDISHIANAAADLPSEWYNDDHEALAILLQTLDLRRRTVRSLIENLAYFAPTIFPAWRSSRVICAV